MRCFSNLDPFYRVVAMFSPNHVDYATTIWAAHRLGAIISYVAVLVRGHMCEIVDISQPSEPFVLGG